MTKVEEVGGVPDEKNAPKYTADDLFKSLSINTKIATEVFTFLAKGAIHRSFPKRKLVLATDHVGFPVYIVTQAVALELGAHMGQTEVAKIVIQLIEAVINVIKQQTDAPVLIDAADARVHQVTDGVFNFVLKQRYGLPQ